MAMTASSSSGAPTPRLSSARACAIGELTVTASAIAIEGAKPMPSADDDLLTQAARRN
jgi:hypothetical protein